MATPAPCVRYDADTRAHPLSLSFPVRRSIRYVGGGGKCGRGSALSGGQLQRLLLALALVGQPSVLRLDEPMAGVDEPGQEKLNELVRRVQEENRFALVYIAALGPDETETSQGQQDMFRETDVFKYVEVADGRVWMRPRRQFRASRSSAFPLCSQPDDSARAPVLSPACRLR